jgi:hypothetical protein
MLQAAWAAFEVRLQARAPELLEDLRSLAALVPSVVASGDQPTVLRPSTPAPTGPAPQVPQAPSSPGATERYEVLGPLGRGGLGRWSGCGTGGCSGWWRGR